MTLRPLFVACAALALAGCSTHQLRLKPWAGVPAAEVAELQRGEFRAPADKLFDAAATTLEHEPFLHWSVETLDKASGFIKASGGLLREVQLRISAVADTSSDSANAHSRLEISIPRNRLRTETKVWTKKAGQQTAYEPDAKELEQCSVTAVSVELDEGYLRSFVWRVLHDRSEVPFTLEAFSADEPVAIQSAPVTPEPTPVSTPADAPEPKKLPVRNDAGAPTK